MGLQFDIYSNGGYGGKPAFMQTLKDHLLSRLLDLNYDGNEQTFTLDERNNVHLINFDAIIESKILCINYTTYDIRRDHDTIRTTHGDVVTTSSRDEAHPFWYAQVLCTFHIQVHFCPGGSVIRSRAWKFSGSTGSELIRTTNGASKTPVYQR